jgi:chromosome segregation ATPase
MKMDKIKNNFVIVVVALIILCIILAGYAANLNAQLSSEKIKTMQLNDQIAGLNTRVSDLQAQLISSATKTNDQAALVNSLQSSLDKLSAESEKLKTAYADLESKLKEQIPVNVLQPAAN